MLKVYGCSHTLSDQERLNNPLPKRAFSSAIDLRSIVSNAVPVGRSIEYKEAISLVVGEEKRGFLADISAFANVGKRNRQVPVLD
jgi:hypothetical protein